MNASSPAKDALFAALGLTGLRFGQQWIELSSLLIAKNAAFMAEIYYLACMTMSTQDLENVFLTGKIIRNSLTK